jgi:hypothetical protein
MMARIRRLILKLLYPFTVWMGRQRMPFSVKKITGDDYYEIEPLLKRGCVFLTVTRGELSNLVNPGFWKHGAMYIGDHRVIEALGRGVVIRDLISFLMSKDYVAVMAPKFASEKEMRRAAEKSTEWEGIQYDYWFEMNDKAFYCYEVIYKAYMWALAESQRPMPFEMKTVMGSPTIKGDDFYNAHDKWLCLWDNSPTVSTSKLGEE